MESKRNYRLQLIEPIQTDYIYDTKSIETAGKKALSFLSQKYNINESLITLKDIDTNNSYSFMASKKQKPINLQGGATADENQTQPPDFLQKVKEITDNMNKSVDTLQEAVVKKQKKDDDTNIYLIARNGVSELKNINDKLEIITKKIDDYGGNLQNLNPTDSALDNQISNDQKNIKIEEAQIKMDKTKLADQDPSLNLLEPSLGDRTTDENLCVIM